MSDKPGEKWLADLADLAELADLVDARAVLFGLGGFWHV